MNEPLLNHFHAQVPFLSLYLSHFIELCVIFKKMISSSNSIQTGTSFDFTWDVRLFYIIFFFFFLHSNMYSDLFN